MAKGKNSDYAKALVADLEKSLKTQAHYQHKGNARV